MEIICLTLVMVGDHDNKQSNGEIELEKKNKSDL